MATEARSARTQRAPVDPVVYRRPVTRPESNRRSVWIVDDSAIDAERARQALAPSYEVRLLGDGSAALEHLAQGDAPDVLVLDWMMPGVSGIEVCQFVRGAPPRQRELGIVLLTARPIRVQPQTLAWLDRYDLRWDALIMRDRGDYMAARTFKQRTVQELRAVGFDLRLAFEDDPRNVHMFHSEDVPCIYIHSGYYE